MSELIIKTINGEFEVFLGDKELGLVWPDTKASIIDHISVGHPATSNDMIVKIVFKNWLGGLHEAYHDKVFKAMDETVWALEYADITASFWLRPNFAGIDRGEKNTRYQPRKRNNEDDNS